MRAVFLAISAAWMLHPGGLLVAQEIDIRFQSGDEREAKAATQLRRLLREYDLTPWIFTRTVRIETGVIPHSHPVLTLNPRYVDDDERQLSTFLHEQVHWFLSAESVRLFATVRKLRDMYPKVPAARPEGSGSEFGTYLHLIVCWFELEAMTDLIGLERARQLLGGKHHYTWIYRRVIEDTRQIGALIHSQGLVIISRDSTSTGFNAPRKRMGSAAPLQGR